MRRTLGWKLTARTVLATGILGCATLAGVGSVRADGVAPPADEITLERIMADPDWIGNSPEDAYWSDDGKTVYFSRKAVGSDRRELYRQGLGDGARAERVPPAERGRADQSDGAWSPDFRLKTFLHAGDVFVKDVASGDVRQLTRTSEQESSPFFMADGKRVAFQRDGVWLLRDLEGDLEAQAADLRLEKDPEAKDDPTFLTDQQLRLFDVLQRKKSVRDADRAEAKAEQSADPTRPPLPFYLGADLELLDSALSPSGKYLIASIGKKQRDEGKKDSMPDYVTESGYVEIRQVRPRVGAPKAETPRLVLFDLVAHTQTDLDPAVLPGITDDPLKALREAAEAARKAKKEAAAKAAGSEKATDKPAKDSSKENGGDKASKKPAARALAWNDFLWSADGGRLVLQAFSADNKDRWIVGVDLAAKKLVPLERIHDEAWINWAFRDLGWMRDHQTLWYLSEETGYSHLYLRGSEAAAVKRQITKGAFEVSNPIINRDGSAIYFEANREHPGVAEVYRIAIGGAADGAIERLTKLEGQTSFALSPDETELLLTASFRTRPPELFIQPATAGATARQITDSTSAEFKAIQWQEPEVVAVPSSHVQGADLLPGLHARRLERGREVSGGRLHPRRGLPAERAQGLVELLPRVHVRQPAAPPRVRRCSTWTIAPRPATGATGARRSTVRWATPKSRISRTARPGWSPTRPSIPPASARGAARTAASSPSCRSSASPTSSPAARRCAR
jgi:Tol biopolymer transport system component